jgi:5-methylcytosine-specific restriction enzyme subunit McrC
MKLKSGWENELKTEGLAGQEKGKKNKNRSDTFSFCLLVDEHEGKGIFSLRPDLLVLQGREVQCVMDTKWKLLDASDRKNKYGISQADMYQLYAYGHKYLKGAAEKSLMLIYPKTEFFQEPLPDFTYEDGFVLKVVPFDLDRGELVWSFKQQP